MLNIKRKTKDTIKVRKDFKKINIRTELHLIPDGLRVLKPHACYTLVLAQRKDFCRFLKSFKCFDEYASNISKNVNVNEGKISGLKCHDCHVLLQQLLPIGIRPYLWKDVYIVLAELSNFYKQICTENMCVSDLNKLAKKIILIL